jgi:hypothetical protein
VMLVLLSSMISTRARLNLLSNVAPPYGDDRSGRPDDCQ